MPTSAEGLHHRAADTSGCRPVRIGVVRVGLALLALTALVSCRPFDTAVTDARCANLTGVTNPSVEQLDAHWERLIDLELEAMTESTMPMTPETASQYRQMKNDLRVEPAWRDIVESVPAGGVGEHRRLFCQILTDEPDSTSTSPDEAEAKALGERYLQLVKREPYFALYIFGPATCGDYSMVEDAESEDSELRQALCPIKRLPMFSTGTPAPR
ncbi:hypothetical protein ACWEKT_35775 [Nocardia takedensis]